MNETRVGGFVIPNVFWLNSLGSFLKEPFGVIPSTTGGDRKPKNVVGFLALPVENYRAFPTFARLRQCVAQLFCCGNSSEAIVGLLGLPLFE